MLCLRTLCVFTLGLLITVAAAQDVGDTINFQAANIGGGMQNTLNAPTAPTVPGLAQPGGITGAGLGEQPEILQPTITVVRGTYVRDAVTGSLLDVPELTQDYDSQRASYSNDGQALGDLFADDEIWSDLETLDDDFIGPETHSYILRYINMLRLLDEMDPLEFAGVGVASPDPVSSLPHLDGYEEHQDNKVEEWNERFLRVFRLSDPITRDVTARSEFYPVYVPPPPFIHPIRPDFQDAVPPTDFLTQCWIGYMGGVPNPQAIIPGDAQTGAPGSYGYAGEYGAPPGDEELIGGSSQREWTGQSAYFGENER